MPGIRRLRHRHSLIGWFGRHFRIAVILSIQILLAIGAIAYLGGVAWAGIASLQTDDIPEIPGIVTQAITVIGGVLATHTGAVFGIARYLSAAPRPRPKIYNPVAWSVVPKRAAIFAK